MSIDSLQYRDTSKLGLRPNKQKYFEMGAQRKISKIGNQGTRPGDKTWALTGRGTNRI